MAANPNVIPTVASAAGARGGVIVVHGIMDVIALVSQCMPSGCAPSPLPRSDTDIARHRSKRSLFCCRTADPSHTDATMWPKHAPETSAADTNWSCGPRGFHVHAWSEPRMCLHHAHFLSCASVGPRLRRVPRASMATHQKREEGGFSRENLSGENLQKKSSDLKFAREGPHPSAVTLRTISSALARA